MKLFRSFLLIACVLAVLAVGQDAQARPFTSGDVDVETVLSYDGITGAEPENVAVARDGTVYTALSFSGQISILEPGGGSRIVDVPNGAAVSGLVAGPEDVLYFVSFTKPGFYLLDGDDEVSKLAALPEGSDGDLPAVPNGMTADRRGNLYAADSTRGVIWRLAPGDSEATVWADDPAFEPLPGNIPGTELPNPGSNGLTIRGNKLFVTNPSAGTVLKLQIRGDRPGPVLEYAQVRGDDIAFDVRGGLWITSPFENTISVIDKRTRQATVVADAADGLESPTAIAFAPLQAPNRATAYISTASFIDPDARQALQTLERRVLSSPIPPGPNPAVFSGATDRVLEGASR